MNVYDTLAGLSKAVAEARADAKKTDLIFQEVNGKVMSSSATASLKTEWQDLYAPWCRFALETPLLNADEPRLTSEALRAVHRKVLDDRRTGLLLYQRWKTAHAPVTAPAGRRTTAQMMSSMGGPNPVAGEMPAAPIGSSNGLLRYALIGGALICGAAALKALFTKPETPPAAPGPTPLPGAAPGVAGFVPGSMPIPMAALAPMLMPTPTYYPHQLAAGQQIIEFEDDYGE